MAATEEGGYGQRDAEESPGKSGMKLRAIAARRVEMVGENSAACAHATSYGVLV
jgi:hypothetical protein